MDEVDVKILKLLWEDGRMPLQEVAKKVGLSTTGVHKRLRAMKDRGELNGFSIILNSDKIFNSAVISVRARKRRREVIKIMGELSGVMHIVSVIGGRYYAEIWYGDEYELRDKVNYIRRLTGAYRIDVYHHKKLENLELSPLDWKILLSLKRNARRPFKEVAEEIGISSKTVAKRCRKLREIDACRVYPIVNRPSTKEIFWFSLFIETDDSQFEMRLGKIKNLWRVSTFSSPPMVYGVFYGRTIQEVDEIMESVVGMKGVKRVFYEIIVHEKFYPEYIEYVAHKLGL